jgi:plasmid stability protein
MRQLIVRNVEEAVVTALRARAARHGRSAEAEHREILRGALLRGSSSSLKKHLLEMPDVGKDSDFRRSRRVARKVEL